MHALFVTVFISLVLVIFFLGFFWQQTRADEGRGSGEREALLPLEEDDGGERDTGKGPDRSASAKEKECLGGREVI